VLVKLALVLAWRGSPSMCETLRAARTHVSMRDPRRATLTD
jgi:hypothetical protein